MSQIDVHAVAHSRFFQPAVNMSKHIGASRPKICIEWRDVSLAAPKKQRNSLSQTFVAKSAPRGFTDCATSIRWPQRSRLPSHCQSAKPPQHNLYPPHLIYQDSYSPVVFISSTVVPAGIQHLHTAAHNLVGNARLHAAEVLPTTSCTHPPASHEATPLATCQAQCL